jgi:precorrin-2 dehydrogenase/sirohydrochlorin ferrochelatase
VVHVRCKWRRIGEWLLLIDLRVEDKASLVIGGGKLGERKVQSLLDHDAIVTVISKTLTPNIKKLAEDQKITAIEADIENNEELLEANISKAFIVYAATNNKELNNEIAESAKKHKVLVCAVDMPEICDFYSPSMIHRGSIRVGICTDGKSPLMSRVLRQRLEGSITDEDVLRVELQHYARELSKSIISDSTISRELLYQINDDHRINQCLRSNQLDEARLMAEALIREKAAMIQETKVHR